MKKNKCEDCLIGFHCPPYEIEEFYESYLNEDCWTSLDEVFNYCPYCRS